MLQKPLKSGVKALLLHKNNAKEKRVRILKTVSLLGILVMFIFAMGKYSKFNLTSLEEVRLLYPFHLILKFFPLRI